MYMILAATYTHWSESGQITLVGMRKYCSIPLKILCSWFLSHHACSYSDLVVYRFNVNVHLSRDWNRNIISWFSDTKTAESHLGVRKSFWRTSRSEIKDRRFRFLSFSKIAHLQKHCNILCMGEEISRLPDPWNFTSRRQSK